MVPVNMTDINGVLVGKTISQISAGANHNLILTASGQVFGFGSNAVGQRKIYV
jgi:alpha-tubulin suppressor-like RCC1 family protein